MKQRTISKWISAVLLLNIFSVQVQAQWQSLYYRDHALVGKIFSTETQQFVSESQLLSALRENEIILLGETHTNPDHHIGQAHLIEQWMLESNSAYKSAVLVLEMLAYDDWADFRQPGLELAELKAKLEQVAGRWQWNLYEPILQLQIKHQMPMVGGNLTREQLDKYSSAEACQISRYGEVVNSCGVLDEPQKQIIKRLIFDAHCEYLPMAHTQPMMQVQAAKDAAFALSVHQNAQSHRVVLIAGAVHVRKDIGVPVHLRNLANSTNKSFVSLAFMNVQPDKIKPDEYFEGEDVSKQFDYVLFTPSERDQDPCVEFAEQLKKMKHKQ